MRKVLLPTVFFIAQYAAIQVSQALQKNRAELSWRQEVTNKFSWNATQELKWSVVNAFIDVQTSPDGDVYAIQNISSEMSTPKYSAYLFNTTSNIWELVARTPQVKAVRFDRLGSMFYLTPDNCVLTSQNISLLCGVKDFEVTVDRKIFGLNDGSGRLPTDTLAGQWKTASGDNSYSYKALSGFKGLTLLKDQPIFIAEDGSVDAQYGSEKLVSISAGIDGSLWALQQQSDVNDFQLLKWQTVAQKWYKVNGAKGTCLSAYNEISVAIVDSKGLLSLSSQAGLQIKARYAEDFISTMSIDDINWLKSSITGKQFSKLTLLETVKPGQFTVEEVRDSFVGKSNIFIIYFNNFKKVVGLYFEDPLAKAPVDSSETTINLKSKIAILRVTDRQKLIYEKSEGYVNQQLVESQSTIVGYDKGDINIKLNCVGQGSLSEFEGVDVVQLQESEGTANSITGSSTQSQASKMHCLRIEIFQGE
ncbi:UNKNOWN [Stylonychia lemnae]|uniref:Uncharacterized protein n=1 Tax=Stylonychia lemnae TaxID=5949 RepID=A0A077ZSR4_STYLE|nr:UNKNOWN [Stylonychia lemnae]|eukprot:CDW72923.1 UNKNOWN [Stylonychia lemnae]